MRKQGPHVSEQDLPLLNILQQSSNLTIDQLAKKLKVRPHIARRSIERLQEAKIIIPYAPINTAALGFTEYRITLARNGSYGKEIEALLEKLFQHEHVALVGELAGEVEFIVCARNAAQFGLLTDKLLEQLPAGVTKKVHTRRWLLNLGLSLTQRDPEHGVLFAPLSECAQIDEVDHKVLRAIASSGSHAVKDISRLISLPTSTVAYRLKQLIAKSVVLEPRYSIDVSKLGLTRARVRISTPTPSMIRSRLVQAARAVKEVPLISEVVGAWDFELDISAAEASRIEQVLATLCSKIGGDISRLEVVLHTNYRKIINYPFRRFPM